jgi:hypothetical protein
MSTDRARQQANLRQLARHASATSDHPTIPVNGTGRENANPPICDFRKRKSEISLSAAASPRGGEHAEVYATAAVRPCGRADRPAGLLYSLQWKHNGTSPDLHLQLVRDPQRWFDMVSVTLLAALSRGDRSCETDSVPPLCLDENCTCNDFCPK